jgi:hypothetical protein
MSIQKRNEWSKKYRIGQRVIYDLFSEFSCMAKIAEEIKLEDNKTDECSKRMKNLLPIHTMTKMSKILHPTEMPADIPLQLLNQKSHEIDDIFVPLSIYRKYSTALKMHKKEL